MYLLFANCYIICIIGEFDETVKCCRLCRNKHGDTPLDLMRRKGIAKDVIQTMEDMIDAAADVRDDAEKPLLRPLSIRSQRFRRSSAVTNIWFEFCADIGAGRLIVIILVLLCMSLYVAYVVTGFADHIDTRIPIDDSNRMEL